MTPTRKPARTIVGTVTSNKMKKTIVVQAVKTVQDRRYGKYVRQLHVFKAHDEKNEARIGARVRLMATRPLSKTKRWNVKKIIEKAAEV